MSSRLDPDRRRGELARQAFPHFAEVGYHALGLRDLARRMGVTTGALYHYFEGKSDIFRQAVRERIDAQIEAALRDLLPVEDRAMRLIDWLAGREDELLAILRVGLDYRHAEEPGEEAPAAFIQRMLATYERALAEHLGLSALAAAAWVSLCLGVLTRRLLDPSAPDLRAHRAAFAALGT